MTGKVLRRNILKIASMLPTVLLGCSHMPQQETSPDIKYKLTSEIKVKAEDTHYFNGIGVVPKKSSYEIRIESNGYMDQLRVNSCSREIPLSDVGSSEWIEFKPDDYFEGVGRYCPLYITGLEQKKERHTFGMILFHHPKYKLRTKVVCNGAVREFEGVGFCQNRQGLPAAILLDKPFKYESSCHLKIKDGKFIIPGGECVVYIGNQDGKFRLTTYGYEQIIGESL